jgi:hypothetical protein
MQRTRHPIRRLAGEADADKSVEELDCAKSVEKLSSCRARQDSERLVFKRKSWSRGPGLNRGPTVYETVALPTELPRLCVVAL